MIALLAIVGSCSLALWGFRHLRRATYATLVEAYCVDHFGMDRAEVSQMLHWSYREVEAARAAGAPVYETATTVALAITNTDPLTRAANMLERMA